MTFWPKATLGKVQWGDALPSPPSGAGPNRAIRQDIHHRPARGGVNDLDVVFTLNCRYPWAPLRGDISSESTAGLHIGFPRQSMRRAPKQRVIREEGTGKRRGESAGDEKARHGKLRWSKKGLREMRRRRRWHGSGWKRVSSQMEDDGLFVRTQYKGRF